MRPKNVTKENRRFIQGAMIINAPSASFNLGKNGIKRLWTKGEDGREVGFSYLSGQFIKSKIRETLQEQEINLSIPQIIRVSGKEPTATTSCNPFEYLDDDLFGYMNIIKEGEHPNRDSNRVGPFKISYFLGKEGDLTKDYAIKQRKDTDENGNLIEIAPHILDEDTRYFSSTSYSGCFSIDVNFSGRFFKRETSGFKNLHKDFPIDNYKDKIKFQDDFEIVLKDDIRENRLKELINSFPFLSGGARLSTVYSDLSPKFVIYCVTDSGNHLFQEIASIYKHFNVKALIESVTDFRENLKSDIYIALKNGFLDSIRKEILDVIKIYNSKEQNNFKFVFNEDLGGINAITKKFTSEVIPEIFKIENI